MKKVLKGIAVVLGGLVVVSVVAAALGGGGEDAASEAPAEAGTSAAPAVVGTEAAERAPAVESTGAPEASTTRPAAAAVQTTVTTVPENLIESGVYEVGVNIQPGVYRLFAPDRCYWARLAGFTGGLDDIIANGNHSGYFIVEVRPRDAGFELGCDAVEVDAVADVAGEGWMESGSVIPAGVYEVGLDIQPGIHRFSAPDSCYWARLAGFTGEFGDLAANGTHGGYFIVEVRPSDTGFEIGCDAVVVDSFEAAAGERLTPASPSIPAGVYEVGSDIQPGVYRLHSDASCYWARLAGFSGGFDDLIANDATGGGFIVSIEPSDAGFEMGCSAAAA